MVLNKWNQWCSSILIKSLLILRFGLPKVGRRSGYLLPQSVDHQIGSTRVYIIMTRMIDKALRLPKFVLLAFFFSLFEKNFILCVCCVVLQFLAWSKLHLYSYCTSWGYLEKHPNHITPLSSRWRPRNRFTSISLRWLALAITWQLVFGSKLSKPISMLECIGGWIFFPNN